MKNVRKVECICINDKDKPKEVPSNLWVKKDEKYTITHVFAMVNQEGIKGCEIAEIDVSHLEPYNCFRLDRFAFTEEGLKDLIEMIKNCTEFNNVDINTIVEKLTTQEPHLI